MSTVDNVIGLENVKDELTDIFDIIDEYGTLFAEDKHANTGMILAGRPGCGKTLLIREMVSNRFENTTRVKYQEVQQHEFSNGTVSKTSEIMDTFFGKIRNKPEVMHILFIDEIESKIPSTKKTTSVLARERTNGMLAIMDGVRPLKNCFIIGSTNIPEELGESMLRNGRFGDVMYIKDPNMSERVKFVKMYISDKYKICEWGEDDEKNVSAHTIGFNGADFVGVHLKLKKLYRRGRKLDENFGLMKAHVNFAVVEQRKACENSKNRKNEQDWMEKCIAED